MTRFGLVCGPNEAAEKVKNAAKQRQHVILYGTHLSLHLCNAMHVLVANNSQYQHLFYLLHLQNTARRVAGLPRVFADGQKRGEHRAALVAVGHQRRQLGEQLRDPAKQEEGRRKFKGRSSGEEQQWHGIWRCMCIWR